MMEQKKAHSEEYFNESRNFYWNHDYLQLIAQRCYFNTITSALDVGAGQGHWIQALLPFLPPDAKLFAVEPEERSRRIGNERLGGKVQFLAGTAEKLPFPDGHFSMVTCQTLLIHVKDPLFALQEMLRVLKPGGLILAAEPNNLFAELVRDSLNCTKSIADLLDHLRFVLLCHQGKEKLGEGENNRGDFLLQYLQKLGVTDLNSCISDKTIAIYPPYAKAEQKAVVKSLQDAYKARQFYWTEHDSQRFFHAGGGSNAEFQRHWSRLEKELCTILQEIEQGRYYSPNPSLMYLAWGRKP